MISAPAFAWGGAAVLLFWCVGGYNRLVRLRHAVAERFVPVDAQFQRRHALLLRKLDALAPLLAQAGPRLQALRAACQQVEITSAAARSRPSAAAAVTSLRVAEDILQEARARLPVSSAVGSELAGVDAELAEADAALTFARRQYNEAVAGYNAARCEFPTWLLARVFGFGPCASL